MKRLVCLLSLVALVTPAAGATTADSVIFSEYETFPGGFVAWGDYDQDGDLDLVTGCIPDGTAHIFHNDPVGVFTEVQALPCAPGIHGNTQPWADYDQDGDLDLALLGRGDSFLYQNDHGTFVQDTRSALPVQYSGGVWFQWGDIDDVGGPDLAVVGVDQSGVFLNDGTGLLYFSQDLPTRDNQSGDLGDYDSDGDVDLVVVGAVPGGGTGADRFHLEILHNESGWLTSVADLAPRAGAVRWVDYDGDGWLDIFAAGGLEGESSVELWHQDPGGVFTPDANQPALEALASLGTTGMNEGVEAWGDYDGDGDPDLIVSTPVSGGCITRTYRNDPGGRMAEDSRTGLDGLPLCYLYPTFGDFDADGDLDLAVSEQGGNVKVFINGGAPAPVPQPSPEPGAVRISLSPSIPTLEQSFQFNLTLEDTVGMPLGNYSFDLTLLTPSGETVEGLSAVTTAQGTWQIPETYFLDEPGPYVYNFSIEGLGSFNYTAVIPGPAVSINYEDLILSAAERGGLPTEGIQVYTLPVMDRGNSGRTHAGETTYVPDPISGILLPMFDPSLSEEDQLRLYAYQYLNPGDYTYVPPDPERLAGAMALLEEDARRDMAEFAGMLDDGLTLVIFAKEAFVCSVGIIGTGATAGAAAPVGVVACAPLVIHLTTETARLWLERECTAGRMLEPTCGDLRGGLTIASSSIQYIIAPEATGAREGLRALGFATSFLEGSSEIIYGSQADGTIAAQYAGNAFEFYELAEDASDLSSSLMLTARSPIQFEVVDPGGRRLGYDPETNWIVSEIPGASITLPGMEPQRAWIPNPVDGDYEVDVTGTGTGDYAIEIARTNRGESPVVETVSGSVTTGEQVTHEVEIELDDQGHVRLPETAPAEQPTERAGGEILEGPARPWIIAGGSLFCCLSTAVLVGVIVFFVQRRRRKT